MDNEKIIAILQEWADAFGIKGFVLDALRSIGWALIKGLKWICDGCYTVVTQIYSLLGFTNSEAMQKYLSDIHPLVVILLTISIALLGYYLIFKRAETQVNTLQNLILIILVIVALPTASAKMANLTTAGSDYVRDKYIEDSSPGFTIIDANFTDLLYVDGLTAKDSFSSYNEVALKGKPDRNNLNNKKMSYVDINAYMDYEDDLKHDLWEYKLDEDSSGSAVTKDMDNGLLDFFPDYYYRYSVNWWQIIFSLIAMATALLFTAFKSGKIVWEIGAHQVIGPFIAVTDLATGQRLKEFIRSLISLFAALFLIAAMFGLYFIGIKYLNSLTSINAFTKIVAQIALAWLIIDGPNVCERILGVDIGIRSGYQMVVGGLVAARGVSNTVKKTGHVGKSALHGAGKVGKAAGFAFAGKKGIDAASDMKDAMKDKAANKMNDFTSGSGVIGAARNMGTALSSAVDNKRKEKADSNIPGSSLKRESALNKNIEHNRVGEMHQGSSIDNSSAHQSNSAIHSTVKMNKPQFKPNSAVGSIRKNGNSNLRSVKNRTAVGNNIKKSTNSKKNAQSLSAKYGNKVFNKWEK